MESPFPIHMSDDLKADEIAEYERNQRQINRLEDMEAIGDLQEVQQSYTRGECVDGVCNHTILGTVYCYDAHTQHLYFHREPLQNISCLPELKNNLHIQLSEGSPYQDFIGYLQILYDPDCQTYDVQKDQVGWWYLKVKPKADVIEEMEKRLARQSIIRVDVPNSYSKFNRRQECLSRFCQKQDAPLTKLATREFFEPMEFETLNQCSNFSQEQIRPIVDEVTYTMSLNPSQRHAIEMALSSHLHCIQGPPGTGKTQTLLGLSACFLKLIAAKDGGRSLICVAAPSNETVDDLDHQLLSKVNSNVLRIGKQNPKLLAKLHCNQTNTDHWVCNIPAEEFARKSSAACILSGTTSAFGNEQTTRIKREVDVVLIDEAARDCELDTLQVLEKLNPAGQGSLIGDPRQLGPCIQSQIARRKGGATAMMCRLENQPG